MRKQMKAAYSGGMTMGTRKRLARAVTIMTQAIRPAWRHNPVSKRMEFHRFSFITLTVSNSDNITARQGYDLLLSHFLDWMTRTAAKEDPTAKTYIWKAELQVRGQLHYHITTPAWIHYKEIRAKWNDLQRKAGLLDDYAKQHGHFDPNSTDIHNTRSVKNADRYMIKELGKTISAAQLQAIAEVNAMVARGEIPEEMAAEKVKEIQAEKVRTLGRIWGCSEDLAGVNYFTTIVTRDHEYQIAEWERLGMIRKKTDDFFAIIFCDGVDPPDLLNARESADFKNYLKKVMQRDLPDTAIPEACVQTDLVSIEATYSQQEFFSLLN
jgi:hypothetical protein